MSELRGSRQYCVPTPRYRSVISMNSTGETPKTEGTQNDTEFSIEDVKQELYNRHHPSLTFLDIEATCQDYPQD